MTATVDRIEVFANKLSIYYAVEFSNIGETIATDVRTFVSGRQFGDDWRQRSSGLRDEWIEGESSDTFALMPSEAVGLMGESHLSIESMPWVGESDPFRCHYVINAAAVYRLSGDTEDSPMRICSRMFLVGYRNPRRLMQGQLYRHRLKSAEASEIAVTMRGPSITT